MKGKKRYREVDVFAWEMPGKEVKKERIRKRKGRKGEGKGRKG